MIAHQRRNSGEAEAAAERPDRSAAMKQRRGGSGGGEDPEKETAAETIRRGGSSAGFSFKLDGPGFVRVGFHQAGGLYDAYARGWPQARPLTCWAHPARKPKNTAVEPTPLSHFIFFIFLFLNYFL